MLGASKKQLKESVTSAYPAEAFRPAPGVPQLSLAGRRGIVCPAVTKLLASSPDMPEDARQDLKKTLAELNDSNSSIRGNESMVVFGPAASIVFDEALRGTNDPGAVTIRVREILRECTYPFNRSRVGQKVFAAQALTVTGAFAGISAEYFGVIPLWCSIVIALVAWCAFPLMSRIPAVVQRSMDTGNRKPLWYYRARNHFDNVIPDEQTAVALAGYARKAAEIADSKVESLHRKWSRLLDGVNSHHDQPLKPAEDTVPAENPVPDDKGTGDTYETLHRSLRGLDEAWGLYRLDTEAWFLTKPLLRDDQDRFTAKYQKAYARFSEGLYRLNPGSAADDVLKVAKLSAAAWKTWYAANDHAVEVGTSLWSSDERETLRRLKSRVDALVSMTPGDPQVPLLKRSIENCLLRIHSVPTTWDDIAALPAIESSGVILALEAGDA